LLADEDYYDALWEKYMSGVDLGTVTYDPLKIDPYMLQYDVESTIQHAVSAGLSPSAIQLLYDLWAMGSYGPGSLVETLWEEVSEVWEHTMWEIPGGMDVLPTALFRRAVEMGVNVQLGQRIVELHQRDGRVDVVAEDRGRIRCFSGAACICTMPVSMIQRLTVTPEWKPKKQAALDAAVYDRATKVLLEYETRFWEKEQIRGGGSYTNLPIQTVQYPAHADSHCQRGILLGAYAWAEKADYLASLPPLTRAKFVADCVGEMHIGSKEQWSQKYATATWNSETEFSGGAWMWSPPSYYTDHFSSLIEPHGQIFFAGEHCSIDHGWQNGAFASAQKAVIDVHALLSEAE
jgi:monoamine oxidase